MTASFFDTDLLIKTGKLEHIINFIRDSYDLKAFFLLHFFVCSNDLAQTCGRDIFQFCKVKYKACGLI